MSYLDSALGELLQLKKSLSIAAKYEIDSYRLKKYTEWMGRCAFTEKYIQQEVEHGRAIEAIRAEREVEHHPEDVCHAVD